MAKKLDFRSAFDPFDKNVGPQNLFPEFYLYKLLDIVPSYHHVHFKEKLMNQTWEHSKQPNFGPNFGLFDPNLGLQNFFRGFSSTKF